MEKSIKESPTLEEENDEEINKRKEVNVEEKVIDFKEEILEKIQNEEEFKFWLQNLFKTEEKEEELETSTDVPGEKDFSPSTLLKRLETLEKKKVDADRHSMILVATIVALLLLLFHSWSIV